MKSSTFRNNRVATLSVPWRGEHGQDQDWIFCRILAIFWIRIGFGYLFLKKKMDQDRIRIFV